MLFGSMYRISNYNHKLLCYCGFELVRLFATLTTVLPLAFRLQLLHLVLQTRHFVLLLSFTIKHYFVLSSDLSLFSRTYKREKLT